jgi:FAD/FMN-containing dehydrogenase/Fe-S oxidoreductase
MPSLRTFRDKLARALEGEVRFDPGTLAVYATDSSNYRQIPVGVVIPRHEADVEAALSLARENSVPILARGAGTSLAGQACNSALVMDFSKYMNRVLAIDERQRLATVEPGVVQGHLNAALKNSGLFFAPDPSTKDRCTLGGMIGNNSCGAHSAAYGKTADNLESLEMMLYDGTRLALGVGSRNPREARGREGEIYARLAEFRDRHADAIRAGFPRIPRRVSGYNLDQLLPENGFNLARAMVGSEGTLGLTLKATVRLVPRAEKLALVVLGFEDVFIAADQTPWLMMSHPQALEGFDQKLADFARARGLASVSLLPAGKAFLLVELGAQTEAEVRARAGEIIEAARRVRECTGVACLTDPVEQRALWNLRSSGLGAGAYVPGYPRAWPGAEDTAVAPEKLGPYMRRFDELLSRHGLQAATYYGHFGEGCVHARINFDLASASGIATFRAAMTDIASLVAEFGGSLSGEHGDGIARSEFLPALFSPKLIEAFREFKHIFDPDSRMNPGVLVDPKPVDSNLKLGASYRPVEPATHFDFSADGGLAGAALKCVGIGKCRKTDAGTMCPSYMATREEKHSTRGRARILLEALTGGVVRRGLSSPALAEALDLCLSCKGCRTECPSGVDMAKYKAEFLAHYYRERLRSPGAWLLSRVHEFARLASLAPRLANRVANTEPLASLARRLLAVHRQRKLPHLAPTTFRAWFERRPMRPANQGREVVLFADTFNNFFEPEVAIAAVEVLERAGFRVTIPARDICCGRPLYDQGMLERARWRLAQVMDALGPALERGSAIVGLEPGCLLTFRDELPALFPGYSKAQALRDNSFLLDEFLARNAPGFAPGKLARRALLHGHCHQKALAGLDAETALLSRIEGLELTVLDAGCCGMAGAFGYAVEHYEVSKAVAERVLIAALRESTPETLVISDGFSCRSQIRQFCPQHRPMHLAQVLAAALTQSAL